MIGQIRNIRFTYQSVSVRFRNIAEIGWVFRVAPAGGRTPRSAPQSRFIAEKERAVTLQLEMPATFGPRQDVSAILWAVFAAAGRLRRAIRNRREAAILAEVGDRALADIGLTRTDLCDAFAEPVWRDPTELLARRAGERQIGRRCTNGVRDPSPIEPSRAAKTVKPIRFLI
jgi:uncharacterized protein YjiS (DUF1127 family)